MRSPSNSLCTPPSFTISETLSWQHHTSKFQLTPSSGEIHETTASLNFMSFDAKKNCKCNQAFHLTSLSARPYRANAALCCNDPFFESRSSSKGLSPPSWTIPAWLCVFCEDYIKSVNIRSPNNPQHIIICKNWVITACRQKPSKNHKNETAAAIGTAYIINNTQLSTKVGWSYQNLS